MYRGFAAGSSIQVLASVVKGPLRIILIVCAAQTLAQLGAFTFPALLPGFIDEWHLSHTQAGWLSGIFFGAYALSVPVLVTLTDRVPARRIYLLAVSVTTLSHLGMAMLAEGFWTGLLFRILAGVGWAGTYMVGLRALTDELDGAAASRAVSLHAAGIGVSGALSFVVAGAVGTTWGYEAAFVLAAVSSAAALGIAAVGFPAGRTPTSSGALLDFRPVFRNRRALSFSIGYCVHNAR